AERQLSSWLVQVVHTDDSLAVCVSKAGAAKLVFRVAYTPAADLTLEERPSDRTDLCYGLSSSIGRYIVSIHVNAAGEVPTLHYETHFTPDEDFHIPYWPKDMLLLDQDGHTHGIVGSTHVEQVGLRSGMVY